MSDQLPVTHTAPTPELDRALNFIGQQFRRLFMYFSPGMRAVEAMKARQLLEATGYVGVRIVADDQEAALLILNATNTRMLLATVLAMLSLRAKYGVADKDFINKKMDSLEPYLEHMAFYDGQGTAQGTKHIQSMASLIKATEVIRQVFVDLNFDRLIQVYMGGVRPFVNVQDFALFEQRTGIKIEIIK